MVEMSATPRQVTVELGALVYAGAAVPGTGLAFDPRWGGWFVDDAPVPRGGPSHWAVLRRHAATAWIGGVLVVAAALSGAVAIHGPAMAAAMGRDAVAGLRPAAAEPPDRALPAQRALSPPGLPASMPRMPAAVLAPASGPDLAVAPAKASLRRPLSRRTIEGPPASGKADRRPAKPAAPVAQPVRPAPAAKSKWLDASARPPAKSGRCDPASGALAAAPLPFLG